MAQYASYKNLGSKKENDDVPPLIEVQDLKHRKKILTDNNVVCIDIFANWCGPCKAVGPKFARLAKQYNSPGRCMLVKENADLRLPREGHKVSGIPAFLFYKGGYPVRTENGGLMVTGGNINLVEKHLQKLLEG